MRRAGALWARFIARLGADSLPTENGRQFVSYKGLSMRLSRNGTTALSAPKPKSSTHSVAPKPKHCGWRRGHDCNHRRRLGLRAVLAGRRFGLQGGIVMDKWQPIETAPKIGVYLVYLPNETRVPIQVCESMVTPSNDTMKFVGGLSEW